MVLRLMIRLSLAALFVSASFPVFSQVVPAAVQQSWPLEIGGGLSYFSTHIVNHEFPTTVYPSFKGSMLGPAAWLDWTLPHMPRRLYGLGIEAEGRQLSWANTGTDPQLREDTGEGGVIYMWRRHHNFHPYGKYLMGFGSVDFEGNYPLKGPYPGCTGNCDHDTGIFDDLGGGAEYRIRDNLWVRGDYEYELWTKFGKPANKTVYPRGFTFGVSYDLRGLHFGHAKEF
jgi:hypothetical protein